MAIDDCLERYVAYAKLITTTKLNVTPYRYSTSNCTEEDALPEEKHVQVMTE